MCNRRTRIVATLGPATDTPEILNAVLRAGVDMARINFSHGAAEEHLARVARLRDASRSIKRPIAILADLPGPKHSRPCGWLGEQPMNRNRPRDCLQPARGAGST